MTETKPFMAVHRAAPSTPTTGAPVLLIHGFYSSGAADWPRESWVEPIVAAGRRVIVVDLPAHGDSAAVTQPRAATTGKLVEALAEVVAEAGTSVDVVGYSLGARIGWALAAKRPDLVNRAVLAGLSNGDPFATLDFGAARKFADTGERPADAMTAMIVGMAVAPGRDAHSLINAMEGLGSEPFRPEAEAPTCPVLLAAGLHDPIAGNIDALERFVAGSRTRRMPGDHFTALHAPEFRQRTFEFLGLSS